MSVGALETVGDAAPGRAVRFPTPEDATLPPADRDLRLVWQGLAVAVVAACSLVVLWQLDPRLLLRNTTPSGGDMGAHVWFPAFLRDHLLPNGRVAGWSPDWFGGFPAGQFYFPLPALLIVLLDVALPYNVAFKLVSALGPVALPGAVYAFGRGLRVRRPGPELMAVGAVMFLFFKGIEAQAGSHEATIQFNQRIMGGTLVSALAGEYSFSLALSLAFGFLGALAWSLRTRRRLWLPAVLLAATVLSHVVVGIFAGVGGLVVLLFALTWDRRSTGRLLVGVAVGVVGALLSAFWTLPLLATFGYTANMRYEKLTWYLDYLLPRELLWVAVLALVGTLVGLVRRDRAILAIVTLTLLFAAVFRFWPELQAWNLRFLPFWYLGLFLLAAIGAAELTRGAAHQVARVWIGSPPLPSDGWDFDRTTEARRFRLVKTVTATAGVAILAGIALTVTYSGRAFLDFWVEWNYSGYEDTSSSSERPKANGEYRALLDAMGALPRGRALWEGGQAVDAYGTPLALMLLPYWTDGRIGSMEGLYYESAASTPYVFMAVASLSGTGNASNPVRGLDYRSITDFDLGVRYLRELGARYYLAHSDEAKARADANPDLELVARVPDQDNAAPKGWNVYEVRDQGLVAPLRYEPVVVQPRAGTQSQCFGRPRAAGQNDPRLDPWECVAARWWNDPDALDRPLAAGGPSRWARAGASRAQNVPRRRLPATRVTQVRETDDAISFRVSRTGVPVVVRSSYFPNWAAEGADGPWRLTPNEMVVVPTSRTVTLRYSRTPPERLGIVLTLVGVAGLAALVRWRPRGPEKAPERGPRADGDPERGGTSDAPEGEGVPRARR